MKHNKYWLFITLFITAGFFYIMCRPETGLSSIKEYPPAQVEPFGNEGLKSVTLTEKAIERLSIETVEIKKGASVIPYSAVLYDLNGENWIYINPESAVYVRKQVKIDHVENDQAVLSENLSEDMVIVTVGVAELFGAEFGVGQKGGH